MTPSELKRNVEATGSLFFSRQSMKFFGDTMRNFGVHASKIDGRKVWYLYRKHPVIFMGQKTTGSPSFFDQETFERIFPTVESAAK